MGGYLLVESIHKNHKSRKGHSIDPKANKAQWYALIVIVQDERKDQTENILRIRLFAKL